MKNAVRRVLLLSALMSPSALYALGLGEIRLNSALNQPFDAEIELVAATAEDLGALRAALAPTDTFARYGLDRPAFLNDFNFRVAQDAQGRDVLRVTSARAVTEPFVTLLVEASWTRGRLLREYTVLLDPPVFTPGPAASEPVAAPRVTSGGATTSRPAESFARESQAPAPSAQPAPARAERPRESVPVADRAPNLAPGGSYRVRPNDTLWQIASRVNPGTRSDVNRAMVSIYQQNPQAFDGNINLLRAGSTLNLPAEGQIAAVSAAEAAAEVARQYDAWRSGTVTPAGADAARLRLVTPEQGSAAPSTAVTPTPAPGAKPAPGTPAAATTASAAAAAGGDLEGRVRQLESELAEARRLLEVRNAELATLQGGTPPAEAAAPTEGATPGETAAPTEAAGATPEPAPAAEAPPAEAKPAPAPAQPEGPTALERLQDYWWVLLGILAAALGVVLLRRLRKERGAAEENLEEALARSPDMRSPPKFQPRPRDSDILVEEKRPVEPVRSTTTGAGNAAVAAAAAGAAVRGVEPGRRTVTVEDTLSGDTPGTTEPSDPLAEADFHMAYGLYDQAADLVQLAIKREPERRELKLKLLEIFFVWGNKDRFLAQARELYASRGAAPAGEWDKVLIMGKQIAPEEAMFAGAPSGADALDMELHGATGTLDMDMSDMPTQVAPLPDFDLTEKPDTNLSGTSGLDFVFDEPGHDASESQVAPTIETPRVRVEGAGDTQEVTVDKLGLDIDALRDLDALDDTVSTPQPARVDDTIETRAATPAIDPEIEITASRPLVEEEVDLLSSTSLMNALDESTALIDLSEATGELARVDDASATGLVRRLDYEAASEPATMSEVGTKLDLARAYMDMGDPEGARSILDEVLAEGNAVQKQEAERLIASLP